MKPNSSPSPTWTDRTDRAIPKLPVPSLRQVAPALLDDLGGLRLVLLGRPVLGLAAFATIAASGWWVFAPIVLWFLYGSTTTAIHHLIHGSLGLTPRARRRWLTGLGLLIVESGHAWQTTHVLHHRDGTDLPDPEGYVEALSWAQLPLGAAKWRFRIAAFGWRHTTHRRRVTSELAANAATTVAAIAALPITPVPFVYVALMQCGTFLFAVVLAKGPHNEFGHATTPLTIVHTRVLAILLFSHDRHLEHHAYPKVPMSRLHHVRPAVVAALADHDVHHVHLAA